MKNYVSSFYGIAAHIVIRLMAWFHSLFTNRMTMPFNVTGFEAEKRRTMFFKRRMI
jgi:hypothetical protein